MRTHGKITRWNDDRGFGFIDPAGGKGDIFVHISAFPRDGVRPQIGELISFTVETGPDGRQRAVGVMRPGQRVSQRPSPGRRPRRTLGRRFASSVALVLFVTLALYAWNGLEGRSGSDETPDPIIDREETARYSCDGRTMCSQMNSCGEAEYFIRNCPNTQMDGDGDGVPCESQWCN